MPSQSVLPALIKKKEPRPFWKSGHQSLRENWYDISGQWSVIGEELGLFCQQLTTDHFLFFSVTLSLKNVSEPLKDFKNFVLLFGGHRTLFQQYLSHESVGFLLEILSHLNLQRLEELIRSDKSLFYRNDSKTQLTASRPSRIV
jgi:hypothetical protein